MYSVFKKNQSERKIKQNSQRSKNQFIKSEREKLSGAYRDRMKEVMKSNSPGLKNSSR